MDEGKEQENNATVNDTVTLPFIDEDTRKKINLAIYHDGLEVTTFYVNNVLDKFRTYFNKIFLVSEDDENLDELLMYENLSVVSTLKPISLKSEWLLILEPGEFPSIQLINNLSKVINELAPEVIIVRLPLVICNLMNGEIIDIIKPVPRLYRQKPQVLHNTEQEEASLEEYPLIKLYVEPSEVSEVDETES
jgi:hypothetical protein